MQVVEGFDDSEQILEQTGYAPDGTVVQFEGEDAGDSLEQGVLQFGESNISFMSTIPVKMNQNVRAKS